MGKMREVLSERRLPTGECRCRGNAETSNESFFWPGDDKVSMSAANTDEYGGVFRERNAKHEVGRRRAQDGMTR